MSPISIVLSLIFFVAFSSAQWEGEWTYDGQYNIYLCDEVMAGAVSNMVYGMYSQAGSFQLKSVAGSNQAKGKFYGAGWFYGGEREGNTMNFQLQTGKVRAVMSEDSNTITWHLTRRGNNTGTKYGKHMQMMSTRVSTTVGTTTEERTLMCGITSGSGMVSGAYVHAESGNTLEMCQNATASGDDHAVWARGSGSVGSGEDMWNRYYFGGCYVDGKVCTFDFYSMSVGKFGVSLMLMLTDGRLLNSVWYGPTTADVDVVAMPEWHTWWTYTANETSEFESCLSNAEEGYIPYKCASFDNEFCESQEVYGLCTVSDTRVHTGNTTAESSCFRTKPYSRMKMMSTSVSAEVMASTSVQA